MRTFRCVCDNVLFFDNSVCLRCQKETGFCPACHGVTALLPQSDGSFCCGNTICMARLAKCANYAQHNVCNRCVCINPDAPDGSPAALCDCCSFTKTIPDLRVAGNMEKWYRLEAAKRRLFYGMDLVGLPYRFADDDTRPKLKFDFKADVVPVRWLWWTMGKGEQVFTGHANGLITINLREANDAERERLRVNFGEAHRTLIGHFRHEIAHFYWEILVRNQDEPACKSVFGDHEQPTYQKAMERYYKEGPPANWQESFVSAYATMHPWEDFAETFATYLDMTSVLDTASNAGFLPTPPRFGDFDAMLTQYRALGIGMNEINRSMGLLDLVPEVFVEPVRKKMKYVHQRVTDAALTSSDQIDGSVLVKVA